MVKFKWMCCSVNKAFTATLFDVPQAFDMVVQSVYSQLSNSIKNILFKYIWAWDIKKKPIF